MELNEMTVLSLTSLLASLFSLWDGQTSKVSLFIMNQSELCQCCSETAAQRPAAVGTLQLEQLRFPLPTF